ncbi:MAG: hypothetical protein Q8S73_02355 [Deltaproteobacteria bacterium]|nr:hypothetical protein [Myxococcales bacterium]MDP3212919.1 hypothetical protein [Deltaproteobacteria bacterium]
MANHISYDCRPDLVGVQMSNGLTSVFVSVLVLAASALAQTDRQREFAAWFASRDQNVFGLGMVGFDIGEMPWRADTLEADRDFVLRSVEAAKGRSGWDRLGYEPREDWVFERLEAFRSLVAAFDARDAETRSESDWSLGVRPAAFTLCAVHAVYLHAYGCALCGDA